MKSHKLTLCFSIISLLIINIIGNGCSQNYYDNYQKPIHEGQVQNKYFYSKHKKHYHPSSYHKYAPVAGEEAYRSYQSRNNTVNQEKENQKYSKYVNITNITANNLPDFQDKYVLIINNNQATVHVKNNRPYVQTSQDHQGRPSMMNAVLTKQNRFYNTRKNNIDPHKGVKENPIGWRQQTVVTPNGRSISLYNRSHLLGYAMANFKKFDFSEYNQQNVITGTEAFNQDNVWGMNFYENIVRKGLDQNKVIRYQVKPIYKSHELIPRGVQMQANSSDHTINYNVFIYNVEPGFQINYHTGMVKSTDNN